MNIAVKANIVNKTVQKWFSQIKDSLTVIFDFFKAK